MRVFANLHRRSPLLGAALGVLLLGVLFMAPQRAHAEYVEYNLIDNAIYLNAASMSHAQVQSFLVARGGYIANYVTFSDRDNANVSASQIIYEAAQDYGINPQVIMAMMQKEQSLITATNPTSSQLNYAMGYGCPDASGCTTTYLGFYKQVDNATWQLRFNYERASGNYNWWRPGQAYACNGATRYYSKALLPGNNVTFYDDYGTAYKTFTINNAPTASLYCYTPHAYPGSAAQYYSGSYNFVVMFERWFGSTQPAVVITTPLRVQTTEQGAFTNSPVTVWFDMFNNRNEPVDIGGMSVAVRGPNGENLDYPLQSFVIPARTSVRYAFTQTFTAEGQYTFWITNFSGGSWKDDYPVSSYIDNYRQVVASFQAMPTITVGPASNVADMRQGKMAQFTFKVKNNSQQAMNIGMVGLAARDPQGGNVDMPLQNLSNLAAQTEYTYTANFMPVKVGTYSVYVTSTKNGGITWNETNYPASEAGVNRRIQFAVKSSPTLTQGPQLSIGTPRVGQSVTTSFKIKNYADAATNIGIVGLAVRDPLGRNVDPGSLNLTINGNTEYTYQANTRFQTPGIYTAWVTVYRNGAWDDASYPVPEDTTIQRRIQFTVLPNPTITVQPTVTTTDPRVGKAATATFTIHNYADQPVTIGTVALAVRDPLGRNADFAPDNVTIPANSDYVYTATNPGGSFINPGIYTAWITVYRNGTWDDTSYPAVESSSINRRVQFVFKPSPALSQGPQLSVASPQVNQQVTASFKVRNFSDYSHWVGFIGMAIRDPQGRNVDAGALDLTVNANSEFTFSAPVTFTTPGTYTAWITLTRDNGRTWDDVIYPNAESGVQRRIQFTVTP